MTTSRQARLGIITLLAGAALGSCTDVSSTAAVAPVASAETATSNISVPYDAVLNGCTEPIQFTGELHILFHSTLSSSGNYHVKFHFQPQGVQGTGLRTGAKYQATGVTQVEYNFNGPLPFTESYINNFRLIGQGPDNNLLVHENFHITINSNGDVTAVHDNFSVECR
jgi:hypothetical protein